MAAEDTYREASRRSHKLAAFFLVQWAWNRGADCVYVGYDQLVSFIWRERIKSVRFEWFQEDIRKSFPYVVQVTTRKGRGKKEGTIFLSRKRFPIAFGESLGDDARAKKLSDAGVVTVRAKLPSEAKAIGVLAQMNFGISDFPIPEETDRW